MNNKIIAVTGATGQQGNAVAKKLLADGWKVRALTRDINKPAAQELKALGAELVAGDMDNRAELDAALRRYCANDTLAMVKLAEQLSRA